MKRECVYVWVGGRREGEGRKSRRERLSLDLLKNYDQCSPQPKLKGYWYGLLWVGLVPTSKVLTPPQSHIKDKSALKGKDPLSMLGRTLTMCIVPVRTYMHIH